MQEAANLAESTSVLLNVSEFDSIDSATSALISTMQAFNYAADDSMHVVDIMNIIGNNFAVSTDGLATALQSSASALMSANNSYQESAAMVAAANKVVQDASQVGSGLRTISLRLRGTEVEGEDNDGLITSQSKLRGKIQSLSGVDILTDTGAYKSTYQILLEISEVWEKMNDMDQAALLEIIAGKNRSNIAAALLSNTEDLKNAYESALDAEGSAYAENEKYLQSIQGRIDLFNNALQTMWSNTLSDDTVNRFVDFGTSIIELIDNVGLLRSAFILLTASQVIPWLLKGTTGANTFKDALTTLLKPLVTVTNTGDTISAVVKNAGKAAGGAAGGFTTLGGAISAAGAGLKAFVATPLGWLTIAALIIGGIVVAVDALTTSFEEQVEILQEARDEYKKSEQELQSLQSELETTQKRIEELQSLDSLTIIEKEELEALKEYNIELAKRNKLAEYAKQQEAKELADEAANTWDRLVEKNENGQKTYSIQTFLNHEKVSGYIDGNASENFEENKQLKNTNQAYIDAQYELWTKAREDYLASIEDDDLKIKFLRPDWSDETLALANEHTRQNVLKEWDPSKVQTAINEADEILQQLEAAAFNTITNEETGYQKLLDDMTPRYEYLMEIDSKLWTNSDKDLVARYQQIEQAIQDIWMKYDPSGWFDLSKQEIWNDDQFRDMYAPLSKLAQDGNLDEDELRQNFDDNIVNALIAACEDKGILLADLLNDITVEASRQTDGIVEETSIIDTLSSISNLEDAYNSLGDAIKEFKEEGIVSAGTLEDFNETFKDVEGFEELYKVLATGEGDVESAITNVANAYINQKEFLLNLSEDEKQIMIARLEALGVTNAEAVFLAKETAEQELALLGEKYNIDLNNYATAEQAKLGIAMALGLNVNAIEGETIEELASKYGEDLKNYTSVAEAKIVAAQKVAEAEAKANRSKAIDNLNQQYAEKGYVGSERYRSQSYRDALNAVYAEYDTILSSIPDAKQLINEIRTSVDNAYKDMTFDFSGGKIGIGSDYADKLTDKATTDAQDALDKIQKEYDNKLALLEAQKQYLENEISRLKAEGEPVSRSLYDKQIEIEKEKLRLYEQEKTALLAQMGTVPKHSDEWYEMAEAVWDVEHSIQDSTLAIIEANDAITQLYIDAFENTGKAYDDKISVFEDRKSYIEDYISYLENLGVEVPADMYQKLIENENQILDANYAKLTEAEKRFAEAEKNGLDQTDENWVTLQSDIREIESAILASKNNLVEFNKAILEGKWEKFDEFIDRIDTLNTELENVYDLISDEDVALEDGSWTKEGITQLGLLYHQLELNENKVKEYNEEIEELNADYAQGKLSEADYTAKLKELSEAQWDAVDATESIKDAIIDANEARIDAIRDGINKEIEAYQELIDIKREELDAERDLYDFKRSIEEKTTNIGSIERRIASLSGSTDASDIAERRRLEAELRDAQQGLNDSYYDHTKDQQSQALDEEAEAFEESKNRYLEKLEETLEDTELLIENTMLAVLSNADVISEELNLLAAERGITLTSNLTGPWELAAEKAKNFKDQVSTDIEGLINEDGVITLFGSDTTSNKLTGIFGAGSTAANGFETSVKGSIDNIKAKIDTENPLITSQLKKPWEDAKNAANTFNTNTIGIMDGLISRAKNMANAISAEATKSLNSLDQISNKINNTGTSGLPAGSNTIPTPPVEQSTPQLGSDGNLVDVRSLQNALNWVFNAHLDVDGKYGVETFAAVRSAQKTMGIGVDGKYGPGTRQAMLSYIDKRITDLRSQGGSSMIGQAIQTLSGIKKNLPLPMYAKGTLGTKKDEWAITDESWLGEEITLAAGKSGQLQYLRKGSSVIPADISANLVEWGKLDPNMIDIVNGSSGMNVITNAINKPEINLSFDALVKAEAITEETLPAVKKFVTQELDRFTKQLNYALKGVGGR